MVTSLVSLLHIRIFCTFCMYTCIYCRSQVYSRFPPLLLSGRISSLNYSPRRVLRGYVTRKPQTMYVRKPMLVQFGCRYVCIVDLIQEQPHVWTNDIRRERNLHLSIHSLIHLHETANWSYPIYHNMQPTAEIKKVTLLYSPTTCRYCRWHLPAACLTHSELYTYLLSVSNIQDISNTRMIRNYNISQNHTFHRTYTPLTLSQLGGLHLLLTTLITHGGIIDTDMIASTRHRYPTVRT